MGSAKLLASLYCKNEISGKTTDPDPRKANDKPILRKPKKQILRKHHHQNLTKTNLPFLCPLKPIKSNPVKSQTSIVKARLMRILYLLKSLRLITRFNELK